MRTFFRVVLSFVGGLIVTYVTAVAAMLGYMSANDIFDRDGGMSMAIMFAIGPLCGIVGGTIAAIAIPVWLGRRKQPPAPPAPAKVHRWPPKTRAAMAAVVSFVAAYILTWIAIRLFTTSFRSYGVALAVSLSPYALGLASASLAAWRVMRNARRETALSG